MYDKFSGSQPVLETSAKTVSLGKTLVKPGKLGDIWPLSPSMILIRCSYLYHHRMPKHALHFLIVLLANQYMLIVP